MKFTVLTAATLIMVFAAPVMANEQLMEKSGCISCHRVEKKLIGPAFVAVAARYKGIADARIILFEKVREGGEGVWDDIQMPPNGTGKISDEDLKSVIEWVLSLRVE